MGSVSGLLLCKHCPVLHALVAEQVKMVREESKEVGMIIAGKFQP